MNTWTITSGDSYGQPDWLEAQRADGAYIIVDAESGRIMEDGLFAEDGARIGLPVEVAHRINDAIAS